MTHRKILFADDSDLLRDLVRNVFEGEDVSILVAEDGVAAVSLARQERPDAIVMDLLMPRLDGLSALLQLQGDPTTRSIPVMLVSGMPGQEGERLAKAYGATEFLAKPFSVSQLVASLHRMLEGAQTPALQGA